ncbi:SIMPL domain-containing protein [Pontibacter kalidii]|uniref:SIMPL domain-containing protein n=1 Tax=Pontibacter kalidii TaxID=2592049 RepID=UPI0022508C46|nr:SIMPL domain-containing protein [Pontibacter kalidii]
MKRLNLWVLSALLGVGTLSSCQTRSAAEEEDYLQVIGEYEQQMPEAGYRLSLSYNGPMRLRPAFTRWADSLQQVVPSMVLTNDNTYLHYMPEQMGQEKIKPGMFQTSLTYNMVVPDSAAYGRIIQSALDHNFPFNMNVTGTFVEPERKQELQQELMQKAMENARTKLNFLSGGADKYKIVGVEELDNLQPYGPEYYEFNRKMVSRVKVKARLTAEAD